MIDEVPFVKSQFAMHVSSDDQLTSLEREAQKTTEELQSHVSEIQDQLLKILQNEFERNIS